MQPDTLGQRAAGVFLVAVRETVEYFPGNGPEGVHHYAFMLAPGRHSPDGNTVSTSLQAADV